MKTKNRFFAVSLLTILSFFISLSFAFSQIPAGSANFSIPEIEYELIDVTECNVSDASITILSPLGPNYVYSLNDGPSQVSPVFANLAPGNYSLKFIDNHLGCNSKVVSVTVDPIPCDLDPNILCEVFVDLKGLKLTETSFNIVMSDDFSDILSNLELSNSSIRQLMTEISSLDIALSYTDENSQRVNNIYNIYNTSMYGDLSSFNLRTWAQEVSGINTANFTGSYKLKITLEDGTIIECPDYSLVLTTESIDEDDPEPYKNLPLLNCESTLDELPNESLPLLNTYVGDIFYIKEFPILISSFTPLGEGRFNGKGFMPLPFQSKYLLVRFDNVFVAINKKIKGSVYGVDGDPVQCTAPAVEFGGEICIPPPPPPSYSGPGGTDVDGYDSFGFDPVTKKHKNNTLYDPNGFDYDGNYKDTDPPSPFNELGCNREGYDAAGNKCDPTKPPLPEVTEFLTQNENNFGPKINSFLLEIKQEYSLKIQSLNCEGFRSEINSVLGISEYSTYSNTVKGINNEYVNLGLSENFAEDIKVSDYSDNRKSPDITKLEKNHVLLFDCDRKSIKYNKIVTRINTILADPELLDQILEEIKSKIKQWNEEEIVKYGDINGQAFEDWMKERLKEKIMELEDDVTLFSALSKSKSDNLPFRKLNIQKDVDYIDYYNSIASIDNFFGSEISKSEKEEIAFYLQNGFNTIKGIDKVHYLEAMTSQFSASSGNNVPSAMPVKISNSLGSMIYTVYLDQFVMSDQGAQFDACIKIEDTDSGKILVFRAENISFGPGGTTEDFKLSLQNDQVSLRINNAAKIHLFKEFTFVKFNCRGFAGAGIKADIEFCPEYILPLNANNEVITDTNYKLHLEEVTMDNWMEFTFLVNASPFALTKYKNIKFKVTNMYIDTDSNKAGSVNIKPPTGYESTILPNSASWKGFYVESLKVEFLSEIQATKKIEVEVNNLIIDGTGVSAYAQGNDVLPDGNMSGWPFTINTVTLTVLHNNVAGFGFGGDLKLPVFTDKLKYLAEAYPDNKYKFTVDLGENLNCPLFFATAKIYDDSQISVVYEGGKFKALASLNGEITIGNGLIPGVNGVIPKIGVTGMQVGTEAPYFNIGTWKVKGDGVKLDFGAFEIGIGLPSGYKPGNDLTNGVYLPISLELDGKYKIYASGKFAILGNMEDIGGGLKEWKYERTDILEFCIGGSFPGVKSITGCLTYFKRGQQGVPAHFGSGFQATVQVKFDKFLDEIQAVGLFGQVDEYKYFFVDATASLQKSIPMGAISLNGFCGGVSNRMQSTFNPGDLNFTDAFVATNNPIGQSASGISYLPNAEMGLGLNAGAKFVLTSLPSLTNGSILIKMTFNSTGGLSEFALKGTAQFLKIPGELLPFVAAAGRPDIEAVIAANVHLQINSSGVYGHFECYLNAIPVMQGTGTNGKLVDAVVKFTSNEWYIWIGQPEPKSFRSGVNILGIMTVNSYFCMGSKIPNFPDIPYEIRQHLPAFESASSLRGGGGGIVFGASIDVQIEVNAYVAAGRARALGGFDVMLRDYSGMSCASSPGESIGLNGWYAAGQAWAMIEGELDVFGINIFSARIAAAFQARLPNPTFVEAALSIEACALWCFDVDLHMTIGEVCEVQSNDPGNILGTQIVSSIVPFTNTQDLALTTKPQIFFNVPVKDGITIKSSAGVDKVYNIRVKKLELKSLSLDIPLPIDVQFNNPGTLANIVPKYLLPQSDSLELTIEIAILEGNDTIQKELKTAKFYTSNDLPTFANNIKYAYPTDGMLNFHIDEVDKEFIVLNQLLYDYIQGTEADLKLKLFLKGSTQGQDIPFTVEDYGLKFSFDISPLLNPVTHYELKIFEVESSQDGQSQEERELYKVSFRTSNFLTFEDKVEAFVESETSIFGFELSKLDFSIEPFDEIELGNKQIRADLGEDDHLLSKYKKVEGYSTYSDNLIIAHCGVNRLPGYPLGNLVINIKSKEALYNRGRFADYVKNVKEYLTPYMEQIQENVNLPNNEFYNFYLSGSIGNARESNTSGTRAPSDPQLVMHYYTPDGVLVSSQIVR